MSREPQKTGLDLGDRASDLNYSLRRYWVDEFHFRHVPAFREGGLVLNLGGLKILRRGVFRIDPFGFTVIHLNLNDKFQPEIIGDGLSLPFADNSFDAVIMSELLEHVEDPQRVLGEAARVLKTSGKALITAPFLNPIHADPTDFGRYTATFFQRELERAGLEILALEPQGGFLSVLADMGRDWLAHRKSRGLWGRVVNRWAGAALTRLRKKAVERDRQEEPPETAFRKNYTTGFGILARKR